MNILLFGPPGAGKGTQSSLLVSEQNMTQISTGDLFRAAIKNKTTLGLEAQSFMSKGQLVPDSVVIGMVEESLKGIQGSFILDGFPRTVSQANALREMLLKSGQKIDRAIFIHVPFGILMGRLVGRRVCRSCGSVYHIDSKPPTAAGACDQCGGELYQRDDDKKEVIEERLKAYESHTAPLIDFYKTEGLFIQIDGNQEEKQVYQEILKIIK